VISRLMQDGAKLSDPAKVSKPHFSLSKVGVENKTSKNKKLYFYDVRGQF